MIKLSCPSCGAEVDFRSKASAFAVCSYCKSTIVRHDMDLEVIGKMADLQDDLTPFQLGTKGVFNKQPFELIGRLKVGYTDGFWNEWYALFSSDKVGWLAEAQGFLAMCFPIDTRGSKFPSGESLRPGSIVNIEQDSYWVDDIRKCRCLYSEGELPLRAAQGRAARSIDLSAPGGKMATLEYTGMAKETAALLAGLSAKYGEAPPTQNDADPGALPKKEVRGFVGRYVDFDDFQFQNLRKIDGW